MIVLLESDLIYLFDTLLTKNKLNCTYYTRFDEALSDFMRFFVFRKSKSNAIRRFKTSFSWLKKKFNESIPKYFNTVSLCLWNSIIFPTNWEWLPSKWFFNLHSFILSAVSTLVHKTHWGFSTLLLTNRVKPHGRKGSLYDSFFTCDIVPDSIEN